jgi:hypothetical protein
LDEEVEEAGAFTLSPDLVIIKFPAVKGSTPSTTCEQYSTNKKALNAACMVVQLE